jgi:hypothetical protein
MFSKKKLIDYISIFFILSLWFCIDTNFENVLGTPTSSPFGYEYNINFFFTGIASIKSIFFSIRTLSPFLIFIILFFLSYFYQFKNEFLTKNKSLNFILIILYINFLFQFIGILTTENHIYNSYYIFVSLFSIWSVSNLYNKNLEKINYLISIIVLSIVVIFFGSLAWQWFLTTGYLQMYGTFPHVFAPLADFSSNVIRSSGLSRSVMIITIPLFYLILIDKIRVFYLIPYSKLVYLIPYIILSSIIYLSQSRIAVLFFVSFSVFSVFYFLFNKTKKYRIQKFFILIMLPIIFLETLIFIKHEINTGFYADKTKLYAFKTKYYIVKIYNDKFNPEPPCLNLHPQCLSIFQLLEREKEIIAKQEKEKFPAVRKLDSTTFTSHRWDYWGEVILKSKKKIIGYGPLGDRYLINENSSNTLIYSYASGGIVSAILMLILIIRYTYLCLFLTFIKKIPLKEKNLLIFSSIFTISFLFTRGIAEVGIGVFSIDFLAFLSCIAICEKFKIQK